MERMHSTASSIAIYKRVPPFTYLTIATRYDSSTVGQCIDPIDGTVMRWKQWVVATGET
jgi:hypothetical protein